MAARRSLRYDIRFMTTSSAPDVDPSGASRPRPTIGVLILRALRLRCPRCGRASIFRGWFNMHDNCDACGRRFNRDPGYLLGSIYFNYGITATLVLIMYFTMYFGDVLADSQRLLVLIVFTVLFPTWFFRYARALWIAFDELWDPWPNEEEARQMNGER
jgi:uncharacterized protein (DUF983 family)